MPIVESEEFISVIGYIVKMSYHLSSNYSCLSKNKHNDFIIIYIFKLIKFILN
jgi:hypothetical protein